MRSVLTCLGIIIGIAAVIAMMEIRQRFLPFHRADHLQPSVRMSSRWIPQRIPSVGGVSSGGGGQSDSHARWMRMPSARNAPPFKWVAPSVDCRAQVIYGNNNWNPNNILGHDAGLSGDPQMGSCGGRTVH
jgi:ABC-type antimicrobial peptide transport system permease subunit